MYVQCYYDNNKLIIIGSDSEIRYFSLKKRFCNVHNLGVSYRLGWLKGALLNLSRGASYTWMRLIPKYIQRTEQVPVELDISAIEEYILLLLMIQKQNLLCLNIHN